MPQAYGLPAFVRSLLLTMPPSSSRQRQREILRPATYLRSLSVAASTHMQKLIHTIPSQLLTLPVLLSLARNPCLRSLCSHSLSCNSYSISSDSSWPGAKDQGANREMAQGSRFLWKFLLDVSWLVPSSGFVLAFVLWCLMIYSI